MYILFALIAGSTRIIVDSNARRNKGKLSAAGGALKKGLLLSECIVCDIEFSRRFLEDEREFVPCILGVSFVRCVVLMGNGTDEQL